MPETQQFRQIDATEYEPEVARYLSTLTLPVQDTLYSEAQIHNAIIKRFERQQSIKVFHEVGLMLPIDQAILERHYQYIYLGGNFAYRVMADFLLNGDVYEIKCVKNGVITDIDKSQLQEYLYCIGITRVFLVVYDDKTGELVRYEVITTNE